MTKYHAEFREPVKSLGISLIFSGGPSRKRQGIFTIRLFDVNGIEIDGLETGLPLSSVLKLNFCYVTETDSNQVMRLEDIRSKMFFSSITLEYQPLFTDQPLLEAGFMAMYLVNLSMESRPTIETLVVQPCPNVI